MAANHTHPQPPSIFSAFVPWTVMGLFSLVLGLLLLTFDGTIFSAVERLAEISRSGSGSLSPKTAEAIKDGINTWGWAGVAVAAITLPLGSKTLRSRLARLLHPIAAGQENDKLPPRPLRPQLLPGPVRSVGLRGGGPLVSTHIS